MQEMHLYLIMLGHLDFGLFVMHLCPYDQGDACDSCPSLPEGNGDVVGLPGPKGERGEPGLPGEGREGKQVHIFLVSFSINQ